MKLSSKSEQQLKDESVMTPGEYDFDVLDATEELSKAGNPQIRLTLKVYDKDGKPWLVTDYLSTTSNRMEFKIRHFCETTGLLDRYNSNELEDIECIGKSGRCLTYIQEDKTGIYDPATRIKDYIVNKPLDVSTAKVEEFNDDISF